MLSLSKVRQLYKASRPSKISQYHLYYFDNFGLGEPIRMLLIHANIKYEETRIKPEEWQVYKPKLPRGEVPMLELKNKDMKLIN